MNELITIIVPIYRVEDYIHRCLNSVLKQTYKNIEIILVDDGSPDKCGEICDKYAKLDGRIKVIHKKNGGLSSARNCGIDIARGEYVTFLDSDDWIHDGYIEKLYGLITKTKSDIAVCNYIKTSTEDLKADIIEENIHKFSNVEALEQLMGEFSVQMVVAWGKLYRIKLLKDIRFPIGRLFEDVFTTYKLIFNSSRIVLTTTQLYYYWQREDSIMGMGMNNKGCLDSIDAYEGRAEFFYNIGLKDLSSRQYKQIFIDYINNINNIKKIEGNSIIVYKDEFDKRLKELRCNLRRSKQKLKFKIFYEMYFILPNLLFKIYEIHIKLFTKKLMIK